MGWPPSGNNFEVFRMNYLAFLATECAKVFILYVSKNK